MALYQQYPSLPNLLPQGVYNPYFIDYWDGFADCPDDIFFCAENQNFSSLMAGIILFTMREDVYNIVRYNLFQGEGRESVLICDISILHKYGKQELDTQLLSLGFSWQEMVVMMALEMKPGAEQAMFSMLLQTDKGNVTRLLNSMEEKGLISRSVREDDCRRKEIRLTALGTAGLPPLHEAMGRWEAFCFRGLSPERIGGFREASQVIIGNMIANHQENTNGEEEKK